MLLAMNLAFYAAVACYLSAAMMVAYHLRGAKNKTLRLAHGLLAAGAGCLVATFVLRWGYWGRVPLTTMTDSLNLLTLEVTVIVLLLVRQDRAQALLCFYAPPLAALCLINAAVAHDNLHMEPRALPSVPLVCHVGLAFLAYALFLLASMTSVAYIFQAHRLKQHRVTGLSHRLPSLEQLDRTLYRLMAYGYPFFIITLGLGATWAWVDRDLLGAQWWLAPKVVRAFVMVMLYAVSFHARRSGRLRGPKLAYLVFLGFSTLLTLYVVLSLLGLNTRNF